MIIVTIELTNEQARMFAYAARLRGWRRVKVERPNSLPRAVKAVALEFTAAELRKQAEDSLTP